MRLFTALPLVCAALLLGACTGTAIINGTGVDGVVTDDDDDVADDDDDVADDDDDVVDTNPFEGEYATEVLFIGRFWEGGDEQVFCAGSLVVTVDAEGLLSGDGACELEVGGQGGGGEITVSAAGSVDDEGELHSGVMTSAFARNPDEFDEDELRGFFGDEGVELWWEGEIAFRWTAIDYEGFVLID